MSALALLLNSFGIPVRGSDAKENGFTARLKERGIPVHIGESEEITEETVVFTGAVLNSHPQLSAAIKAGKRIVPRAELLGRIAEEYPHVLAVAGCHGKTSTTSMLSHVFAAGRRKFTCHIGGEDAVFGNFYDGGKDYFLTEACEFQRSFLSIKSEVAVILNTDRDHTDCYRSDTELLKAYAKFAAQAQRVVVNADDVRGREIPHALSFGFYSGDVRAENLYSDGEKYRFTVVEKSLPTVRIGLKVTGKMQVQNALATYAAARLCGFSAEEIKRGLESFRGVKRRFERVGTLFGVPVVCDYAHHPHEIAATLSTARNMCAGTVRLVFQPHTYTRTRDFLKDFTEVLSEADAPIIYKTFAAREAYDPAGSAVTLTGTIPGARYVQSPEQLKNRLKESVTTEDLMLVLGAGDIYDAVSGILDRSSAEN